MKLYTFIFVFLSAVAFGQKENNQWYFGHYATLMFNNGNPVVPALPNIMDMPGGSSSIADTSGSLLFYTDGLQVINRLNNIMPNGSGLMGSTAATQSTLIVKHPLLKQLYFLFTIDPVTYGLRYSIVDMSLNNGYGDVTQKNKLLAVHVCAKLTGIKTLDGSVWILTHSNNSDEYLSFKISNTGVDTVPVISHCGVNLTANNEGQMKISPDAHHVACCYYNLNTVELCDFDWNTGVVSNPLSITGAFAIPDGLEFSPDASKLYFTTWFPSKLFQVNVKAGNSAAIVASTTLIYASTSVIFNQMQLASNNKIYIAESYTNYVGVINNPDNNAANCNYVSQVFYLGSKSLCENGIPNYLQKFKYNISFSNTCFGDSTLFGMDLLYSQVAAHWNFGDVNSGSSNESYSIQASHQFTDTGNYMVSVVIYFLNGTFDSVSFPVTISHLAAVALGNDSTLCTGTALILNGGTGNYNYLWQNGSTQQTFNADTSGTFIVTVTNGSCSATDSVNLLFVPCTSAPVAIISSSDSSFCEKQYVDFHDLSTNNPTSWQWTFAGAQPAFSSMQNPTGIFYPNYGSFDVKLIACNPVGCDTLYFPGFITEHQSPTAPVITQSNDTLYCNATASNYQWYVNGGAINGAINFYCIALQPGAYFVYITDSNQCDAASNIIVVTATHQSNFDDWQWIINPNINDGTFDVEINPRINFKKCLLQIVDSHGKIVLQSNVSSHNPQLSLRLSNAIYFAQLLFDDKASSHILKLVIHH